MATRVQSPETPKVAEPVAADKDEMEVAIEALGALSDPEPVSIALAGGGTLTIRALQGRDFAAFARAMAPVRAAARAHPETVDSEDADQDFLDLLAEHADSMYEVVHLCAGIDLKAAEALDLGDLCVAWGQAQMVNRDFFYQRLLGSAARNRAVLESRTPDSVGTHSSRDSSRPDSRAAK